MGRHGQQQDDEDKKLKETIKRERETQGNSSSDDDQNDLLEAISNHQRHEQQQQQLNRIVRPSSGTRRRSSRRRSSHKADIALLVAHNTAQAARRRSSKILKENLKDFDQDLEKTKNVLIQKEKELESIKKEKSMQKSDQEIKNMAKNFSTNDDTTDDKIKQKIKNENNENTMGDKFREMEETKKAFTTQEEKDLHLKNKEKANSSDPPPADASGPISAASSANSSLSDYNNNDNNNNAEQEDLDDLPPPPPAMPALQRGTGRELLPQTQPGAVSVRPTQFADDPPAPQINDQADFDFEEDNFGRLAELSEDNDSDSDATPEIPDSLLQGIPQATPIRASIVRQEEESKEELERLQRQMAAKQQEMAEMKRKLQEMERMKQELQNLKAGVGVAVAEPVSSTAATTITPGGPSSSVSFHPDAPFGDASELTHRTTRGADASATMSVQTNSAQPKVARPKGMSEAEFHAYQILIGGGPPKQEKADNNTSSKVRSTNFFTGSATGSKNSSSFTKRSKTQEQNPIPGSSLLPEGEDTEQSKPFASRKDQQKQQTNNSNTQDIAAALMSDANNTTASGTDQPVDTACCVIS